MPILELRDGFFESVGWGVIFCRRGERAVCFLRIKSQYQNVKILLQKGRSFGII